MDSVLHFQNETLKEPSLSRCALPKIPSHSPAYSFIKTHCQEENEAGWLLLRKSIVRNTATMQRKGKNMTPPRCQT